MFNVKSPFQGALLGGTIVFLAFLIYEKYRRKQAGAQDTPIDAYPPMQSVEPK